MDAILGQLRDIADQRRIRAPTPEIQDVNTVRRREVRGNEQNTRNVRPRRVAADVVSRPRRVAADVVSRARRRGAVRNPTIHNPVSNILSGWLLQRARDRNARADQLIQEIDGYLANPITLNRWHFDENFSLFSLEQQADGNWVSTRPNFHESLRSRTRADLIENGLNMNDIVLLRQMALRPAPAEQAIDNPYDLYDPVTESDVEF